MSRSPQRDRWLSRCQPIRRAFLLLTILAVVLGLTPAVAMAQASPLQVTFAARVCDDYSRIMANRARNNLQESLRDLGPDSTYGPNDTVNPTAEANGSPNCRPLPGWRFTTGTGIAGASPSTNYLSTVTNPIRSDIVTGESTPLLDAQGNRVGDQRLDGAVTTTLTSQEMNQLTGGGRLWVQGGTPDHPLNQGDPVNPGGTGFGFGALRCAQDHLNGDNVEFVSFPQHTTHVFCFYYAVSPPPDAGQITVRKQISPDSPATTGNYPFRFDGNVSYEDTNGDGIHDFTLAPSQGQPAEQTFVRGATGNQEPWTFAEVPQPGWNPPQRAQCVSQTGESRINAGTNGATSVHLAAGDHVTCTYTNTRSLGSSAIYKETHGGTGTFPFTITQPDGTVRQETATTTAEGEDVRVADLRNSPSGPYTMRESFPDEGGAGTWALTDVNCNGQSVPFTSDATEGTASFQKEPGSENQCVFSDTFTPGGSISIDKTTQGGTGTFLYEIRKLPNGPDSEPVSQTFQAQATTTEQDTSATATPIGPPAEQLPVVPDAHYTIQEILPPEGPEGTWEMVNADCGPNQTHVDPATQSVDITLTRDNPRAQCHFLNRLAPAPAPSPPSLTITKTAEGKFVQGKPGTYTLTVGNNGTGHTNGTPVTVQDTLPKGLKAHNISGPGWDCTLATLTCTRNDVLNPGHTYPPITLQVKVSCKAPEQVTNTATVTGGGDPQTHTAITPTTIKPNKQCKQEKPEKSVDQDINQSTTQHNTTGPANVSGNDNNLANNRSNDASQSATANAFPKK